MAQPFADIVVEYLNRERTSPISAALKAGLNRDAIRSVLRGRTPSVDRAAEICDALGLEFYIGPPRPAPDSTDRRDSPSTSDAELSPKEISAALDMAPGASVADVVTEMERRLSAAASFDAGALRDEMVALRADVKSLGAAVTDPESLGVRAVRTFEVEAAAGDGAFVLDESPVAGPVWFRRDWIAQQGIDPVQAVVISVRGDSMEPTLPAGCKILVDRRRRKRRNGLVFVLNVPEGLVVKRLRREDDGTWILASDSDSPDWPDAPWPADAEIVGEVRWMSRDVP